MAINVTFNGATIYKPGAYSKTRIDLTGGFALGPVGRIAIFGESTRGKPGNKESNISKNFYAANQINEARSKYGEGPLVDALNFLFSPASDGAIPGGAQAVYIYKTNQSKRATLSLANSYGTVRAEEWGTGGNAITYKAVETSEVAPVVESSTSFDETQITASSEFEIYVDGVKYTQSVAGGYTSNSDFATDVSTWSVPNVTFTAGGSDGASTLKIERDSDATANQNGWGKMLELQESTNTPLATMNVSTGSTVSDTESAMTLTINQTRDLLEEEDTVGGNVTLEGGYDGSESTADVEVKADEVVLTAGATTHTFKKSAYTTIKQLVNAMNLKADWAFKVSSTLYNNLPLSVLDQTKVDAKTSDASTIKPARIKKDAYEVSEFFIESTLTDITSQKSVGLMDALSETALSRGELGATTTSEITSALSAFEDVRVNSVIPLMSRDATEDITDGLTDPNSTYTINGVHQAVKTHCNLMSTTKNRSERQAYLSHKDTFSNSLDRAATLADQRVQLMIQDTKNVDSQGAIKWFQPWSLACLIAGARAGSPVGTPMTFKYFNISGIRHTDQAMTTDEEDIVRDFNPNTQYQQAIQNGITFLESPQRGGFRCVVDNTTYNRDSNWVYNRANVLYAGDVVAFDFRNQLENIFVGAKNTVQVSEVKSVASSILSTFLAQGITVATPEAPNGYKQLDVSIDGNVISINTIVVLVEGIDFVLSDITLTRVQSEA